jgi:hypothetical protein
MLASREAGVAKPVTNTRSTEAHEMTRFPVLLTSLALMLPACGEPAGDSEPFESTDATTAPSEKSGEDETPTDTSTTQVETTETPTATDTRGSVAGETMATLTLDGTTYEFREFENGSCNPDLFGGFSAILGRIGPDGERLTDETHGVGQGMSVQIGPGMADDGGDTGSVGALLDIAWNADDIDTFTIEGNRATGTATFMSETGEGPVPGVFEVICANWCEVYEEAVHRGDIDLLDPELEEKIGETMVQVEELQSQAPEEVSDDFALIYDGLVAIAGFFADHDYDLEGVPENDLEQLIDPEVGPAGQRIAEHCGI